MTDTKTAIVTGSTSGIGLGIAKALCQAGMNVVLNGFGDPNEIENLRVGLERDHGVTALYHSADMTQPSAIEDLVTTTMQHFGSLDVVVNNAGIQYVAPIEDFPPEKWDAILAINLSSAFHTTRLALPEMKKTMGPHH